MSVHFFHCTNGIDLVIDRRGSRIPLGQVQRHAKGIALSLMSSIPDLGDWSDWLVNVYDEGGNAVAILPFANMRP